MKCSQKLSWSQIKTIYPHRYVGLKNIECDGNEATVGSAVVAYTDKDTPYEKLLEMAFNGDIEYLTYTTLDEDEMLEVAP